jgi:hypothetical protein
MYLLVQRSIPLGASSAAELPSSFAFGSASDATLPSSMSYSGDDTDVEGDAGCICPCACICFPACSTRVPPASSCSASSSSSSSIVPCVRLRWSHVGPRTGGGNAQTELTESYATNPCKAIQPKRAALTLEAERKKQDDETQADERMEDHDEASSMTPAAFDLASAQRSFLASSPSNLSSACVVYLSSYGGGICHRDRIGIDMRVERSATAAVTTQGFSKVYTPPGNRKEQHAATGQHPTTHSSPNQHSLPTSAASSVAVQRVTAHIASDGLLLWLPEPMLLHTGASIRQPTVISLEDASSSIVWMDWIYAGRVARGEVYDFDLYQTQFHVHVQNSANGVCQPILMEAMTLEQDATVPQEEKSSRASFTALADSRPANGHTSSPPTVSASHSSSVSPFALRPSSLARRLLPYLVYATVYLLGDRVAALARDIHEHVAKQHLGQVHGGQPPRGILSAQWVEVPIDSAAAASLPPSNGIPRAAGGAKSSSNLRGCVLRLAGYDLEDIRPLLRLYLAPLDRMVEVQTPWQT